MFQNLDVIVENGMLRPVTPLGYEESHRLTICVLKDHTASGPDLSGISDLIENSSIFAGRKRVPVTLEEVREILSKIPPGELLRDLRDEREGRFQ